MNINDYRLDAYRKAAEKSSSKDTSGAVDSTKKSDTASQRPKSVSREIRRGSEPGHEPLVHKAMFDHVNSQVNQILSQKNVDSKTERDAAYAAKTGSWTGAKKPVTDADVRQAAAVLTSGGLIKVPEEEKAPGEKESIYRRVAKFLLVIGVDEAAKILPHLTEEQTEKIIPEIATIRKITPEEANDVLTEFDSLVTKAREEGGLDTARTILSKAFGDKKAEDMIEKSVPFAQGKPFEYLAGVDSERVGFLLHDESPAVQALVLSQLEPKTAAAVITKMDDAGKKDIIMRLAKMQPVSPAILENLDKSLHEKMLAQNTENTQNLDGRSALAQILKRMDPTAEQNVINSLSEQDPDLGADLRQRLFTEEDVVCADNRYMQQVLRGMSDEDVAFLIAGKKDDFRTKILTNVSKTRGDTILEEEQIRRPMRRSDCEKITSQFYATLRRAWEDGELKIEGRDDGEVYV